jgi:2-dehydropantoate 2-reductase
MKICVFGAGAIGCAIAARLAAAGFTTAVLARGAALQAIRANGVRFEVGGATAVGQVAASDDPAALGPQDVVIATVKAHDLPGSAGAIGALLHARSAVVYAVNGVPWWYFHGVGGDADGRKIVRLDPVGALWDEVGVQRAIGCVVNFASSLAAPGAAHGEGPNNRLALGEPKGGASARLREIVDEAAPHRGLVDGRRPHRARLGRHRARPGAAPDDARRDAGDRRDGRGPWLSARRRHRRPARATDQRFAQAVAATGP